MEALFTGEQFDENGQPESVVNILHRYQDIEELFPTSSPARRCPTSPTG